MKKCKYCGRAIRDEARFCLYCMNSLEEKKVIEIKNRRPVKAIIAAGASVVVTAGAVAVALSAGGAVNGAAHIREASYAPLTDTAAVTLAQSGPEDETELVILSLFASADQNGDETGAPEATAPETTESETTASETTVPETSAPETAAPETTTSETTAPETTGPETSAQETAAPETTTSETTVPETSAPETAAPEATTPVSGQYSILPVGQIGYLTPGVTLSDKPFVSYGDWTGYRAEHTVKGEVVQYGDPLIYVYGDGEKAVFEASPESLTGSPSDADAADLAYSMLCRVTGALPGSLCDAEGNDVNALMRSVTNYGGEGYDGILTSLCLPDEHRRVLYTYGMIPEFSRCEFTIGGERSMRVTFEIRRWFSLTSGICVVDCVTLIEYAD